jgi:LemA protein
LQPASLSRTIACNRPGAGGADPPRTREAGTEVMMGAFVIFLILIGVVAFVLIGLYNSLVRLRQQVRNAWSQIDVQLKRRYDLIPNLIETVKGYAAHEKSTFERVVEARNAAIATTGVAAQGQAESALSSALRQVFALAESYPELKANQNFLSLQEELSSTENRISFARQHYNDVVASYNTSRLSFPANLFAGAFGFGAEEFFEIPTPEERTAPQVKF